MSITAHRGEILHFMDDPRHGATGSQDAPEQYLEDGLLVIEEGHVAQCGPARDLIPGLPDSVSVYSHSNALIVPGFIDTHIHYAQVNVIASYGTQLIDWLHNHTFPVESGFGDKQSFLSTAEFFIDELLRNGTTTALVFGTVHPQSVEAFFDVAGARNLRMICGKVMMDRNAPDELLDTAQSSYEQSRQLIKRWHGKGRLGYAVTPRFAATSTGEQLALAGQLLKENGSVHLHTHLSENQAECRWVRDLFPDRIDYLDVYEHYGLLGKRSVFAHGIHLSDREWSCLGESESSLSFCPTSNLFIGSGLFNLKSADKYGVPVGLGTDVGGGDSFSILRTINEAYKVQQLQQANLSPLRSLYLATLGGARVLNLEQRIGNFEKGKEADFIVLDYRATPLLERKLASCRSLTDRLFAIQMLGDDRAIRETWIMGVKQHSRH